MKNPIIIILLLSSIYACTNQTPRSLPNNNSVQENIPSNVYELIQPDEEPEGLLILFGGYPEKPSDIKREFPIVELAKENRVALLLMNFNGRLWLEETEKHYLEKVLKQAIKQNQISTDNIYLGGFSSGGNVSLILTNYLIDTESVLKPKGVFIVDSPIDLLELYHCSQRNVERNFSIGSVNESKMIIASFDEHFGLQENGMGQYKRYSPYLYSSGNIKNLKALKDTKIRFYTEPDTLWWKENRKNEYEDMNAYYIKKLALELESAFKSGKIELIETQNKGIRANGYRHPHSWSIVDKEDLIDWILKK